MERRFGISGDAWLAVGRMAGWVRTAAGVQTSSSQCYRTTADGQGAVRTHHIWSANAKREGEQGYGTWQANWRAYVRLRWVYSDAWGWGSTGTPEVVSVWSNLDGRQPDPGQEAEMKGHVAEVFESEMFWYDLKTYLDRWVNPPGEGDPVGTVLDERSEPIRHSPERIFATRTLLKSKGGDDGYRGNLQSDIQNLLYEQMRKIMMREEAWREDHDGAWGVATILSGKILGWAMRRATAGGDRWAADREIDSNLERIVELADGVAERLPMLVGERPYLLDLFRADRLRQMGDGRLDRIFDLVAGVGGGL